MRGCFARVVVEKACFAFAHEFRGIVEQHVFCAIHEALIGIVTEDEAHTVVVPAVQMGRHREVGVASEQHVVEAGVPSQRNPVVQHVVAPSCDGRLPLRLTMNKGSPVSASDTTRGWYPQMPLKEGSMPCLHSPVVATIEPSASIRAVPRATPVRRHTQARTSLMACIKRHTAASSKRRK
jgi:hypothetical protein